jgi:hypothetical protein
MAEKNKIPSAGMLKNQTKRDHLSDVATHKSNLNINKMEIEAPEIDNSTTSIPRLDDPRPVTQEADTYGTEDRQIFY